MILRTITIPSPGATLPLRFVLPMRIGFLTSLRVLSWKHLDTSAATNTVRFSIAMPGSAQDPFFLSAFDLAASAYVYACVGPDLQPNILTTTVTTNGQRPLLPIPDLWLEQELIYYISASGAGTITNAIATFAMRETTSHDT